MSDKVVDYYYSLASPWSYLGVQRLKDICAANGVTVTSYPIATITDHGWVPLVEKSLVRQAYVFSDLARWVKKLGVPMVVEGRPKLAGLVDALPMVHAAQVQGLDPLPLSVALQKAYWEDCRDVGTINGRTMVATEAGYDGAALAAMESSDGVSRQRDQMFDAARAAGIFGSPTYIYQSEVFWGQDRLEFLADAMTESEAA